jgi:hypothetical protein
MLHLMRNRAGASWLMLVVATLASWALGHDHGIGALAGVGVLAIAAIKVRLVGLDFMELRHSPIPLRGAFEAYCVALWALLSGLYLWL